MGSDKQWIREEAAAEIRRTVRSQSLTTLRLAGQWFEDPPIAPAKRPHWMRVMLVANIDVPNAFANGALGRAVHWGPDVAAVGLLSRIKTFLANVPGIQLRFYHEATLQMEKAHFLPLVDFIDLDPRKETVPTARGKPSMLQLQVQPAYALTIHKVQSMTIRHQVNGCLEGVFAHGQIYVLVSRVTEPEHYRTIGIPPWDLLEVVARAWRDAGVNVDRAFHAAASVTDEWIYTSAASGEDPCVGVAQRLKASYSEQRRVPLRLRTLGEVLNPQPDTAVVLHGLLDWIDRADAASQANAPRPDICRADGAQLFPATDWYLTDLERRNPTPAENSHMDDVAIDEEDLTRNPQEAGPCSSDTSESAEDDSDASLPAGPPPRKTRHTTTGKVDAGLLHNPCAWYRALPPVVPYRVRCRGAARPPTTWTRCREPYPSNACASEG